MPEAIENVEVDPSFRAEVIAGLSQPSPAIPARWLYDRRGSELFDQITRLSAYYPTRTETSILEERMDDIAAMACEGCAIVEFGSGSSTKTPPLLRATRPLAYVPIDISGDYLKDSAARVDAQFPGLKVYAVEADFTREFALPGEIEALPKLGFFPGSTIGNFIPRTACDLLRHFREMLGTGAKLLIGMDRVKPVERLVAAYDDPEGVTAAFNLNLLHRLNRELDAAIKVEDFVHEARWHDFHGRIEMHLTAVRETSFAIEGNRFAFTAGESIHTENSHKYSPRAARLLLLAGGWTPLAEWTDAAGDFALILAEAQPPRSAP